MHARIGCNDDSAVEISLTQIPMFGIAEGKIDQSIIDKIDWLSLRKQFTAFVPSLIAIDDHRVDPILFKEALCQKKLRIKILICRPIIDDCDPPWSARPPLELPLMLKHPHDCRLEVVCLWSAQSDLDLRAASSLSLGQQRIQESTAGVRIYLDQLGTLGGKVEVVTHKYANRSEIVSSDLRSPGKDRVPIAGQSGRGLDRMNDPKHLGDMGFRQEYRHVREQMRLWTDEGPAELRISGLPLERPAQSVAVQCNAEALLVQKLGDRSRSGCARSWRWSVHALVLTLSVPTP